VIYSIVFVVEMQYLKKEFSQPQPLGVAASVDGHLASFGHFWAGDCDF
jgi:hypothetical protein